MTAIAALLSARDRQRLEERLRELRALDREMRAPGSLAAPDEPVPLHRAGREHRHTEDHVVTAAARIIGLDGKSYPNPALRNASAKVAKVQRSSKNLSGPVAPRGPQASPAASATSRRSTLGDHRLRSCHGRLLQTG